MTILVVDDEKMVVKYIKNILRSEGYNIVEAFDGSQALDLFEKNESIQIVVTDIFMPGMDGIELTKRIRKSNRTARPYIIVLTAKNDEETVAQAIATGADDFLFKPVSPLVLKAYVKKAVRYVTFIDTNILLTIPITLLDSKDKYTVFHSRNVKFYSSIITKLYLESVETANGNNKLCNLGFADKEEIISYIETAALLHDVGKIAVPDYLLLKPGRYTPEEHNVMKTHTMAGAKVFEKLLNQYPENPLLKTCFEVTRWHHEWWNGKGYPDGISGEDIPLSARIVAIADVFDALTTRRIYRKVYSPKEAFKILFEEETGHFDPKLLEIVHEHQRLFTSLAVSRLNVQLQMIGDKEESTDTSKYP